VVKNLPINLPKEKQRRKHLRKNLLINLPINLPKEKQRRKVAGGIYSKNKPVSIEQYQK